MVYEGSFSGVLRILFWIFAIGFLIRLIANLALPHVIRKAEERMRDQANRQQNASRPQRPEGHVSVDTGNKQKNGRDDGDYVDYVEIKD